MRKRIINKTKIKSKKIITKKTRRTGSVLGTVLFSLAAVVYLFPLVVTFTNSFMGPSEVERNYHIGEEEPGRDGSGTGEEKKDEVGKTRKERFLKMNLIPEKVTLSQYGKLLFDSPVYLYRYWNSLKLVLPIVCGQSLISLAAAYAFTVLRFRGKELLYFVYIIVMLLPLQVTLMPNYMVADFLNMKESYWAIILPGIFQPMGVFLLRQYMKSLPDAYIEAAGMDGAGYGAILIYIVMPMMKSGMAALLILTFLDYWNLVDQAVIFIRDSDAQPLSVFLAEINAGEAGLAFAGSCFYAIFAVIVLYYGQEDLKRGIAISGLKG